MGENAASDNEGTPGANPVFTEPVPAPPTPNPNPHPEEQASNENLKVLEQRLDEAYKRIEHGSEMLERALQSRK